MLDRSATQNTRHVGAYQTPTRTSSLRLILSSWWPRRSRTAALAVKTMLLDYESRLWDYGGTGGGF